MNEKELLQLLNENPGKAIHEMMNAYGDSISTICRKWQRIAACGSCIISVTYSHHFPLRFRSGGFLFDSPYGLSIRKLSPRAPRFILSPRIRVFSSFLQV